MGDESGQRRRRSRWENGGRGDRWRHEGRENREQKGMRQKERQRVRAQQGEITGRSVTRLRPHLFSASLPIWTINQQREQGKINKNSPAGTAARRTIASLTDKSPQPSTSITQLYSLTSHFLLSLHLLLILSFSGSRFFFSCFLYPSLSLWLMLASHFWVIYIFFKSLHLNLKIKTQRRSSGRRTANAGDEREHKIFEVTSEKVKVKYHRRLSVNTDMLPHR